ncbi:hypothetical protein [Roseimarinus sediminis]|uniref:hypothetical protein n=1 Tax=Roseimarinus sediminis TaxID=1610899 RepID=UPI003D22549D
MKTTKLIRYALYTVMLAAFGLVGCEKLDLYTIDAPADLQSRIDSIAAERAKQSTGDTTYLNIATAIVGAEDNSAAWWTAFSDYFAIPSNKLLHLEFVNHGSGVNNWNNWNLAVANEVGDRDAEGYAEYFVLRADAYGWGNGDFALNMISHNYTDLDGDDDIWNDFRSTMQGAYVTMEIDHSATGNVFVTATSVGTNGVELIQTYQQPVSATEDIVAFLICDGSYFEMKKAYLLPSKVTVVEDVAPVSIAIEGAPVIVELGDDNFWGDAVATVTFADGSTEQVDSADITFTVIPDMTSLGEKTVTVAYSKTKQGAYTQAVTGYYKINVTNPVKTIEVTTLPSITNYYFYSSDSIFFDSDGIEVTATYSDGSTSVLAKESLRFGKIPAIEGEQNVLIAYKGAANTFTTNCPVNLTKGVAQVGANDFSTAWWTEFSNDYAVASGSGKTLSMYCYSNGVNNWHSPCTILRKADMTEYAVVRMDNFGWGDGYATATLTNDWNWDTFTPNINGSKIDITVTNKADNTADVLYEVTFANGDTHFQKYEGITVDSADLNCALVIEGAYVVIVE